MYKTTTWKAIYDSVSCIEVSLLAYSPVHFYDLRHIGSFQNGVSQTVHPSITSMSYLFRIY